MQPESFISVSAFRLGFRGKVNGPTVTSLRRLNAFNTRARKRVCASCGKANESAGYCWFCGEPV